VQLKVSFVVWSVLAWVLLAAPVVEAQPGSLVAARELYAAAEYNGALAMLNGLLAGSVTSAEERQSIELYRTLCLMAVGDGIGAAKAIDEMVARDPLYRPGGDDIPPRVRSALTDARRRLLPSLIQQKYVQAKAAFDQKDFTAAAKGFDQVLHGLSDPDIATVATQSPLADIRVLASGFNDLTMKAAAPQPAPAAVPASAPESSSTPAPSRAAPVGTAEPRLYGPEDGNVVPPVAIRQEIPAFPGRVTFSGASVMDVVIDPQGAVESATLDTPLNPQYDRIALNAAKTWTYQPATLNGVPVWYRKRIQIKLAASR
jgi:hypothetical protein